MCHLSFERKGSYYKVGEAMTYRGFAKELVYVLAVLVQGNLLLFEI